MNTKLSCRHGGRPCGDEGTWILNPAVQNVISLTDRCRPVPSATC